MPCFNCEPCKYTTANKSNFKKHLSTEKHIFRHSKCDNNTVNRVGIPNQKKGIPNLLAQKSGNNHKSHTRFSDSILETDKSKEYTCKLCDQIFTKKNNLYRHRKKSCKKNPQLILDKERKEHNQEVNILKDIIKKDNQIIDAKDTIIGLLKNNQNSGNGQPGNNNHVGQGAAGAMNNIAGNHNNVNNNQIVVNNFPEADRNHITVDQYIEAFKQPGNMIPILMELTRFNDAVPENQNMWLCNKKIRELLLLDNGLWKDKGFEFGIREATYNEMDNVQTVSDTLKKTGVWKQKMLPDQARTFDDFVETYDEETDVPLVNMPHKQHILNDAKDKVFCMLKSHKHKKPKI